MVNSNNQSCNLKNSKSNRFHNKSDDKNKDKIKETEKEIKKDNNITITQNRTIGNIKKTELKIKVSKIDKK